MNVLETLLPVGLLIALGYGLGRIGFLKEAAVHELTRLVFWVALPVLVFQSVAEVRLSLGEIARPLGILVAATGLVLIIGWAVARLRGSPPAVVASMVQNGFRGNLAFVGLPILTYSMATLPPEVQARELGLALLLMAPMMVLYNVTAILVLLGAQHRIGPEGLRLVGRALVTNPLILGAMAGFVVAALQLPMPTVAGRFFSALSGLVVPLALMAIGASFVSIRLTGRRTALWLGVGIKLAGVPLLALLYCHWTGSTGMEQRIILVYAACPTAAASYIMARHMAADADLAASGIALSTALSFIPLFIILSFF